MKERSPIAASRHLVCILILLATPACAAQSGTEAEGGDAPVADLHMVEMLVLSDESLDADRQRELLHQTRNHGVMERLIEKLPEEQRPTRILYLASGTHMAPLSLCTALPSGVPCSLLFTELDPAVAHDIDAFLELARAKGFAGPAERSEAVGPGYTDTRWKLHVAGRTVDLTLRVRPAREGEPTPLVQSVDLEGVGLVLSHDLSGEPLGNLRVVYELVEALRAGGDDPWPMLMIEDLKAHPYPVDLEFFSPLARTGGAYGHRDADEGLARHGAVELGDAVFGGAVLLGFADSWLYTVDDVGLRAVFDLLLFSGFDTSRQNVLTGGDDPLLAPTVLDWWTGFGARSIDGLEASLDRPRKAAALTQAARARAAMSPGLAARLACHLALYEALLQTRVEGGEWRDLLPAATLERRPTPGEFPSAEMEASYRDAIRHAGDYRAELEKQRQDDELLLKHLHTPELAGVVEACSCDASAETPSGRYRQLEACLGLD